MRGGSVGRLILESQATNMLLVNKWLYVIFDRYGEGDRAVFSFLPRDFSPPSSVAPISSPISRLSAAAQLA